jgi:hypothetical protein
VKLVTKETLRGRTVLRVSAAAQRAKKKTRKLTVGSGRYTLAGGKSLKVTVKLNASGRKLLRRFRRLPVSVTVTQGTKTIRLTRLTIKAPAKKKPKAKH